MSRPILTDWRPEDPDFWSGTGKKAARRNLWISVPNLLLAFSVWMVWSMVVAKLGLIGFRFTTDQLFWLTALPALSGATLRIFYSFMVPIFGGRRWTALSTLSLVVPALGIGLAVQNPETPYWVFVGLALLCGLGGGNFASSMSNIAFFFPKAEKGNALAINAGFGNLGVSVMQFLVPLVITLGLFAPVVGAPQIAVDKGVESQVWLQNAGFVWIPFLLASAAAACFSSLEPRSWMRASRKPCDAERSARNSPALSTACRPISSSASAPLSSKASSTRGIRSRFSPIVRRSARSPSPSTGREQSGSCPTQCVSTPVQCHRSAR